MRALSRIANILTYAIVALAIVLATVTNIGGFIGWNTYGILTGSMEPTIPVGALVLVETGIPGTDIEEGDVIAFDIGDAEHTICTHRVVENDREKGLLTTKGDANESIDATRVPYDRAIGIERVTIPYLGSLLLAIAKNQLIWIGCVLAVLISLGIISSVAKGTQRKAMTEREDQGEC